jgi:hypothetical protein
MNVVIILSTENGPHTITVKMEQLPDRPKAGTDAAVLDIGGGVYVRHGAILAIVPAEKYVGDGARP